MDAGAASPVLTLEVGHLEPDLVTLDWLARVALQARRSGRRVALRGANDELRQLIEFSGLADVLLADEADPSR